MNEILVVGAVFAVLIVLVVILKAVRAKQELLAAEEEAVAKVQEAPVSANRGELAAVIASCIAEVLGREVTGLRIVSIKRVG
jgi:Na+-transporting methylmalonyl-CoA/oxaloacetate decarboxylase gamma subunit